MARTSVQHWSMEWLLPPHRFIHVPQVWQVWCRNRSDDTTNNIVFRYIMPVLGVLKSTYVLGNYFLNGKEPIFDKKWKSKKSKSPKSSKMVSEMCAKTIHKHCRNLARTLQKVHTNAVRSSQIYRRVYCLHKKSTLKNKNYIGLYLFFRRLTLYTSINLPDYIAITQSMLPFSI